MTMWTLLWRFFSGKHLDGRHRQHGHGGVMPRYSNYFWNRYSRRKRAVIRGTVFAVCAAIAYGRFADWRDTTYALLAVAPFAMTRLVMIVVKAATQVVKVTGSDGVLVRYRIVRPTVLRSIRRLRPARLRIGIDDDASTDMPAGVSPIVQFPQREAYDQEPPVKRYRRKGA
jgi:hypothetical protein